MTTVELPELFVAVDIESSGPNVAVGDLLTIGAATALTRPDGTMIATGDTFYARLAHDPINWHPDTHEWWLSQDPAVYAEACAPGPDRLPQREVATRLEAWALAQHPNPIFVASPAVFDWQWVDTLMWRELGRNPFSYTGACVRSIEFGTRRGPWNTPDRHRFDIESTVPHHALHDAIAELATFITVANQRPT